MKKFKMVAAVAAAGTSLIAGACVPDNGGGGTTNAAPVVSFVVAPNPVSTGDAVAFDSSGSFDPDGTIASFSWTFGDGETSTEPNPTARYWEAGTYEVRLTVTDNRGKSTTSAPVEIEVEDLATGRYVATTGADTGTCATSAAPCLTVNYAVGQSVANDTITVAPGSYAEIVAPNKALSFKGANSGVAAGVDAGERGDESVIRGLRNGGTVASNWSLTLDGFEIDPTSDPALLTNATGILNIFGGPSVNVINNVFTGAATLAPDCGFTCTDMGDYALHIRSGAIVVADNAFNNWRRPLNVAQSDGANPITSATISNNSFVGVTSRAMSIGASTGQHNMAGVLVDGNFVDATGRGAASTPAGITVTNHSNTITNNTFKGLSSGVFINLCKKFSTDDNTVSSNVFDANGSAINVTTILDTSQCNSGASVGVAGWVPGGGQANNLQIHDNVFTNQLSSAIRFNPNYGTYTTVVTGTDIDATCNYFGSESGPSGTNGIVQGPVGNAQIIATPFLTAEGGACDEI